jgi:hypothetical protein
MNPKNQESKEHHSRVVQLMLAERANLLREIARIDRFLKQEGIDAELIASNIDDHWSAAGNPRNALTKAQVMESILQKAMKPLTRRELVVEMRRAGYAFASEDPGNTLTPLLYGRKRRLSFIHKVSGGFVHVGRRAEFEGSKVISTKPFDPAGIADSDGDARRAEPQSSGTQTPG